MSTPASKGVLRPVLIVCFFMAGFVGIFLIYYKPPIKFLSCPTDQASHKGKAGCSPCPQKQEEEGEKRERYRVPVEEPEHPQGAVVNVALSHVSLASTAAARVSDRVLRDTITIHTYPPVYNYLTKELDLSSVQLAGS
ncbi:coiled-coil domain-containing protein 87-like isoform X2 [Oncorhynchus masou masou]|uniref:coiled-coil domain-containing protein 87-like isoform X2 n=1 Tax=Oncorhynchus masou masou TaxID=90313 RepID=UPI0031840C6D